MNFVIIYQVEKKHKKNDNEMAIFKQKYYEGNVCFTCLSYYFLLLIIFILYLNFIFKILMKIKEII